MKTLIQLLLIPTLLLTIPAGLVQAQSDAPARSRLSLEYFEGPDKAKSIVASLKVKKESYVPYEAGAIYFFNIQDTIQTPLDTIYTNASGAATFKLENDLELYLDSSGIMNFYAEFPGDSLAKSDDADLQVRPMDLKISFVQQDSIKYITATATGYADEEFTTPIEDLEISIYIKGLFSLLNLGEETTDELGSILYEFPTDMPGDTAGVLTIVAKVLESDDYGTVASESAINWGKITPPIVIKHRGLGDTDAPLWMVYTLIILLSAVWFHYLYVMLMVLRIRWAGRKNNH